MGRAPRTLPVAVAAIVFAGASVLSCGAGSGVPGETGSELAGPTGSQSAWCAGDGPAVVLVHGIGDAADSEQWIPVERRLSQQARVCRYDRPGTGSSGAPALPGRGPDALVAELGAVADLADAARPVVLVAHSFGSYPALLFTRRYPERVAALVLIDGLAPSVGVVRGTGAEDISSVSMAGEQLDLAAIEDAVASIDRLPSVPTVVLTRGTGVNPAWQSGQDDLAALVPDAARCVAADSGHQVPTDDPAAVVRAVQLVLPPR